jgi:hypothetical protein
VKFNHPIIRRFNAIVFTLAVLITLGLLTRPIESPAWARVQAGQPELKLARLDDALGQGLVVGMLGGFRAIIADFLWIRANTIWERRDRAKLEPMLRLVTTLDPRPDFFWINSARMIAYDVPNWRIREEGGYDAVPEWRQDEIDQEQARQAFSLISKALEFHSENPRLYLEIGQIHLNRLDDPAAAAPWFLKASKQLGAPRFAARIYAELLRRQGQDQAAYDFLVQLHRDLPDDDPYAKKHIVLERIRDLERNLKTPIGETYRPK